MRFHTDRIGMAASAALLVGLLAACGDGAVDVDGADQPTVPEDRVDEVFEDIEIDQVNVDEALDALEKEIEADEE